MMNDIPTPTHNIYFLQSQMHSGPNVVSRMKEEKSLKTNVYSNHCIDSC